MEDTYLISSNTQLRYDDNLRIGTGNFWQEEFTNAEGETQQGITAGLWLAAIDKSLPNQHVRVYAGQEVLYGKYKIEVVEIGQGRKAPFVRVAISVAEEPDD